MPSKSTLQKTLMTFLAIVGLAFILFLVLPIPFTSVMSTCNQTTCNGYELEITTRHGWYWLGGYHTTLEGLLPMNLKDLMTYMEKYDSIPTVHIAVLGVVSLALAIGIYAIYSRLVAKLAARSI